MQVLGLGGCHCGGVGVLKFDFEQRGDGGVVVEVMLWLDVCNDLLLVVLKDVSERFA